MSELALPSAVAGPCVLREPLEPSPLTPIPLRNIGSQRRGPYGARCSRLQSRVACSTNRDAHADTVEVMLDLDLFRDVTSVAVASDARRIFAQIGSIMADRFSSINTGKFAHEEHKVNRRTFMKCGGIHFTALLCAIAMEQAPLMLSFFDISYKISEHDIDILPLPQANKPRSG
jgi:hypothetical protein